MKKTKFEINAKIHGILIGAMILIQNFLIIAKIGASFPGVFDMSLFETFSPLIFYVTGFVAIVSAFLLRGMIIAIVRRKRNKR